MSAAARESSPGICQRVPGWEWTRQPRCSRGLPSRTIWRTQPRFRSRTSGSARDPDRDNKPARRALILSVLSVVTLAFFWTGLPFALGVPALALAGTGRARAPQEGHAGQATSAAILAALAIVVAIVFCVVG
jgi:Family of unknown function (DUF6410)